MDDAARKGKKENRIDKLFDKKRINQIPNPNLVAYIVTDVFACFLRLMG